MTNDIGRRATLLRIFVDEDDTWNGKLLYVAIVDTLLGAGLAGATVRIGIEGYGIHRVVHSTRSLENAIHIPVLVEVIDEEPKIAAVLPILREMIPEGLLTLESVEVILPADGSR